MIVKEVIYLLLMYNGFKLRVTFYYFYANSKTKPFAILVRWIYIIYALERNVKPVLTLFSAVTSALRIASIFLNGVPPGPPHGILMKRFIPRDARNGKLDDVTT